MSTPLRLTRKVCLACSAQFQFQFQVTGYEKPPGTRSKQNTRCSQPLKPHGRRDMVVSLRMEFVPGQGVPSMKTVDVNALNQSAGWAPS